MLNFTIFIFVSGYTLFSDLDPGTRQGYTPMYQKDIQVAKGVTNTIKFTVKNQDQKPLDISGETLTFNLVNKETGAVHLQKQCTTVDDGSTVATKGVATLTLNESDTADLISKFYKFSVTRTIGGSGNHVTYANTYYEIAGTLEIVDQVYPSFTNSTELPNTDFTRPLTNDFYSPNGQVTEYYSSIVDAQPEFKRNGALHTFQYYNTSYTGTLYLEATLDPQVSSDTSWVQLDTVSFNGSTDNSYINVTGVYNWFRLKHLPDISNTGTLDKVLVRS